MHQIYAVFVGGVELAAKVEEVPDELQVAVEGGEVERSETFIPDRLLVHPPLQQPGSFFLINCLAFFYIIAEEAGHFEGILVDCHVEGRVPRGVYELGDIHRRALFQKVAKFMNIELLDQAKDMFFIFCKGERVFGQMLEAEHGGLLVLNNFLALLPIEGLWVISVHRILRLHLTMLKKHLFEILAD